MGLIGDEGDARAIGADGDLVLVHAGIDSHDLRYHGCRPRCRYLGPEDLFGLRYVCPVTLQIAVGDEGDEASIGGDGGLLVDPTGGAGNLCVGDRAVGADLGQEYLPVVIRVSALTAWRLPQITVGDEGDESSFVADGGLIVDPAAGLCDLSVSDRPTDA